MYIEEIKKTEVVSEYDVAVCGGGFGGISAAIAAARGGKRVILFEKAYVLGGLGTAGIVTIYLPLCDGMGRQVSFGIAEELFRLSVKYGCEDEYPSAWLDGIGERNESTQRFRVQYNPHLFAIAAEQLLLSLGVKIMYGTYVVSSRVSEGKITHIITENKSGRQAYAVKSVVDATGDCDVAYLSGEDTREYGKNNKLAAWYYSCGKDGYKLRILNAKGDYADGEGSGKYEEVRFGGLDGEEISRITVLSHKATLDDVLKRRKDDGDIMPVNLTSIPQIRMSRCIVGEYSEAYTEMHKFFEDSVGMVSDWRRRGPVFEVPYRILYGKKIKNLITAGRCVSTDDELWDVMRVIPCCAVTGQAAGTAAAMTDDFASLDVKALQERLVKDGVVLHECEL